MQDTLKTERIYTMLMSGTIHIGTLFQSTSGKQTYDSSLCEIGRVGKNRFKGFDARLATLILLFIAFISCVEEIEFSLSGDERPYVVINGKVTNLPGPYKVEIMRSGVFSDEQARFPSPISNATVVIEDDLGAQFELAETEPGIYLTVDSAFVGKPGRAYFVQATLPDGGVYRSTPEILKSPITIDRVHIAFKTTDELNETGNIVSQTRLKLLINTQIPSEGMTLFKWDAEGEFAFQDTGQPFANIPSKICWIKDDINTNVVSISDDRLAAGQFIRDQEIISQNFHDRTEFKFYRKYLFKVYQESLTKSAHTYWSEVKQTLERKGGLFESPPDMVRGNISNIHNTGEIALGYFYAAGVDTKMLFVSREDAGGQPWLCNIEEYQGAMDQRCIDCLLFRNSTDVKPTYWE